MKTYAFIHKETGLFAGITIITNSPEAIEHNTPLDHVALEGVYRQHGERYDHASGCVVEHVCEPPTPDHVWVPERLRFELRPEVQAARASRAGASPHQRLQAIEAELAVLRQDVASHE